MQSNVKIQIIPLLSTAGNVTLSASALLRWQFLWLDDTTTLDWSSGYGMSPQRTSPSILWLSVQLTGTGNTPRVYGMSPRRSPSVSLSSAQSKLGTGLGCLLVVVLIAVDISDSGGRLLDRGRSQTSVVLLNVFAGSGNFLGIDVRLWGYKAFHRCEYQA